MLTIHAIVLFSLEIQIFQQPVLEEIQIYLLTRDWEEAWHIIPEPAQDSRSSTLNICSQCVERNNGL